ncbi:MAG: myo-inosose-2 dehydratase [Immundisolibacterales bacterium]|nr:myo-inosose-2 dehydratase [Immundisolibacterales bacterium]
MKKARLGVAPIAWSNDDLPELGGDTPLDTCLSEMAQAGYSGTETGGKYPLSAQELGPILEGHGLALVSGWYSGELLVNSVEEEKRRAKAQVDLFRELGAFAFVYGETSNTIQGRRDVPLAARPSLTDAEMRDYGRRMDEFAAWVNETCGAPFAYHHHMGAVVQFEDDVDRFLACTADETGLLFDTGHLQFSGGDPIGAIARWGSRIRHVHCKDVRADVLAGIDWERDSFLDAVLAGVFTVPGDGMIDFGAVARELIAIGYEGWFLVEAEQDPAKANPLEYSAMGRAALAEAVTAAGYELVA